MKDIKHGEIYFADLNPVVGSEQGGIRPVLMLQNNTGNKHSPTVIIAPITSSFEKTKLPTHIHISADGLHDGAVVLLEQIRTIDKSRIIDFVGQLDEKQMNSVNEAAMISIDIKTEAR